MDNSERAAQVFDKYASFYMEKFMDISLYHNALNVFCEQLNTNNSSILELGCGPGNITQYLFSKSPGLDILATDLAPNMLKLAQDNNPAVKTMLLDSRNISQFSQKFEGLMCGFIFPYLTKSEVKTFIEDAAGILNKEGLIYISTMEEDNSTSGFEEGSKGDLVYMNYHEGTYLKQYLRQNDFDIIFEDRVNYPGKDDKIVTDLILIARFRG